MALSYQYSVGVNKPLQTQKIASASSRISSIGPNEYRYTDTGTIDFIVYGNDVPEDDDYIVIMADQENYLMKESAFTATYKVVA